MKKNTTKAEVGKNKKYPPKRMPQNQIEKLTRIGNGNWRQGLTIVLGAWDDMHRDPVIILQKELEHFGNLVHIFAPENHYEHYIESHLPALLNKFIKTGKVDRHILNARLEKAIDKFTEEEVENAENVD